MQRGRLKRKHKTHGAAENLSHSPLPHTSLPLTKKVRAAPFIARHNRAALHPGKMPDVIGCALRTEKATSLYRS